MDDLKQRLEQAEIDYLEAMAVSSAAMYAYEEAKSDSRRARIKLEDIENDFNTLRREMEGWRQSCLRDLESKP